MPLRIEEGTLELPPAAPFPGFSAELISLPADLLGVFHPKDRQLRWRLDFHYPRGLIPLGHELLAAANLASQDAAADLPVPTSRGLVSRLVGPHVYTAGLPVTDENEVAQRAADSAADVASYPDRFLAEWTREAAMLQHRHEVLEQQIDAAHGLRDLGTLLDPTAQLFTAAWRTHFAVMYRLLAVMQSFRKVCSALDIADADVAPLLASGDTSVYRTDQHLWQLSEAARAGGLTRLFRHRAGKDLLLALQESPRWASWLARFEQFVGAEGHRAGAVIDVSTPSWCEAPEIPLDLIRRMLLDGGDPKAAADAQAHRRARRVEELRTAMTPPGRRTFDRSYSWCRRANFSWWNEEHNTHIDLRAQLPTRALGRAVAVAAGGAADDGLMLYAGEVRALSGGALGWSDVSALVEQRSAHYAAWQARRAALPRAVGHPTVVVDPLMTEIIGTDFETTSFLPTLLRGLAASPGVARGRVRLISDVSQLDRLLPGDVLVCEATSPSWTPVFPRLVACLCDSGGTLTHAAIVCREYGLPCVCALGIATQTLKDGDLVEVDGGAGIVTILQSA